VKKKLFFKPHYIILTWLLIFLAVFLRLYKFDHFPIHNEEDSIVHVWAGTTSLKRILNPISNSIFKEKWAKNLFWYSDYKYYDTVRRFSFHLIDPYLDHPPLAMLFIGLPSYVFGLTEFTPIPHVLMRMPAIFASVFSLFFTFILAKQLFSQKTAFLSLIVLSFSPIFVFSHRQPYLENFLTPLLLLSLIALKKYLKNKNNKKIFIILLVCAGLAPWIKITGIGITCLICFWFLKEKVKFKKTVQVVMATTLSLALYAAYGFLVNKDHFIKSLMLQSGRGMDINAFFKILLQPEFYSPFLDGSYILGFITIFALIIQRKNKKDKETNQAIDFLTVNFILWLFIVLFTTNKSNNFFWYRIPLYPFLSISLGLFLEKLLNKKSLFLFLPVLLLGFFSLNALKIELSSLVIRMFYLLTLAPLGLKYLYPNNKILNKLSIITVKGTLLLILVLNILTILKYPSLYCQNANCVLPNKL
jgi:4-amino-4-deoxy-L-arabinose transferase-like glycosyltransferase